MRLRKPAMGNLRGDAKNKNLPLRGIDEIVK
jgi:hypothetical protein